MRPRTPYTKEPLRYERRHQKPPPIPHSPLPSHQKNIFCGRHGAKPSTLIIDFIKSFCVRLRYNVKQTVYSTNTNFLFRNSITKRLWLKPFNIVPSPQILSDSKKTSSPRRCWTNSIHRYLTDSILIIQLFMLFNCASATHLSNTIPPCKTFGFFKQHNETVTDRCSVWSDDIIPEICSAGTQSRIRILKHVFLFPELQPLSLFEMFSVGLRSTDTWQLNTGEKGSDCISGSINRCTSCFRRISGTLRKLNEAYRSFDTTLSRFDCLPAVDTASATRPFSPNATCENCKVNMDIDSWRHECDCIHPCDVKGIVAPGIGMGTAPSVQHDFFAAQIHCETRKKECHKRFKQIRKVKRSETNNVLALSSSSSLPKLSNFFFCELALFLLLFLRFTLLL
ncbi:hypothetical protein CRE_17203 [Caenorhabditis remanei]|uniref:Uncharacterized protein n=1 Tax=Caenorhabditis remanei TaxID=31234 RepID=E3MA23_CAERE|nr:hypothetical protein CRE_17203 [Caenorhabditis remanei]